MSPLRALTHDTAAVATLAFIIAIGITAVTRYRRQPHLMHLTTAVGAVIAAAVIGWSGSLITLFDPDRWELYPYRAIVVVCVFVVAGLIGIALAETANRWATRIVGRMQTRRHPIIATVLLLSTLAIAVGGFVVAAEALRATTPTAEPAPVVSTLGAIEATHPIPGGPVALALTGPGEGYASLFTGEVVHFVLPDDPTATMAMTTVIDGLDGPRGIAVTAGYLFVTENTNLPCPDPADAYCIDGLSQVEHELRTITDATGRIHRYPVLPDGSVGDRETIVDDLPVVFFDHGVNGLTVGPDGRIYAAIGGLANLAVYPNLREQIDHPSENLIGTIVSFEPDGSDLRVHARGLRNVYHMAFTPEGRMYAVDNDGEALNAIREEELLEISEGGDYGFPDDGSYGPFTSRTHFPLWHLELTGSGGVAWWEHRRAVVIGALSWVVMVELGTRPGAAGPLVGSPGAVKRVIQVSGYATAIEVLEDGRLLVAVLNPWAPEENGLLVVALTS
ncbi:MAG: hypothetical protein WEA29_02745 [Acidimicrobiia bacterium]